MAEKHRLRTKEIRIKVTEDELKVIKDLKEYAGYKNLSSYIRKMIFDGKIIKLPVEEIMICTEAINGARYEIDKIGHNINQLVKIVHEHRDQYSQKQLEEALNDLDSVVNLYDKLCEVMISRLYGLDE